MKELSVPSKCVVFRNGVEIWIPEGEKLAKLQNALANLQSHMFIEWEGRSMNTADMSGIFTPIDMEDMKRRKNGEWQCQRGTWHEKRQECACRPPVEAFVPPVPLEERPLTAEEEKQRLENVKAWEETRKRFKM